MRDWELFLDADFEVTNLWRGELAGEDDGSRRVTPPAWQPEIAPGESFTLGFQAKGAPTAGLGLSISPAAAAPILEEEPAEASPPLPTLDVQVPADVVEGEGARLGTGEAEVRIVSDDVPELTIEAAAIVEGGTEARATSGLGALSTRGNVIVDEDGNAVTLAGVNWFGLETDRSAPDGLHVRNWQEMMGQMAELGFNLVRVPFSNAALEPGRMPTGIDYALNPDLVGLASLEILDKIVEHAATLGLRILLDNHRRTPGDGPEAGGLWYTDDYPEARWIDDWRTLAERYADEPAVIGADLRNEPNGGSWGDGGVTDWAAAAERAGNAILATGSEWLIVVEGVQTYAGESYWWGGNLQGVADRPIELDRADKLVYSAHAYSPEIYEQPWFKDPAYPANLPAIWDKNFGYIHQQGIAPSSSANSATATPMPPTANGSTRSSTISAATSTATTATTWIPARPA